MTDKDNIMNVKGTNYNNPEYGFGGGQIWERTTFPYGSRYLAYLPVKTYVVVFGRRFYLRRKQRRDWALLTNPLNDAGCMPQSRSVGNNKWEDRFTADELAEYFKANDYECKGQLFDLIQGGPTP